MYDKDYINSDKHFEEESITFSNYLTKCFIWMFIGLLVTFGASIGLLYSGVTANIITDPILVFILLIAELVIVFALSRRVMSMKASTAKIMFITYALLNAVVFGTIFIVYDLTSIIYAFFGATILFGTMAVLGYTTKADLSRLKNVLMIGLVGLLITTVLSVIIGYMTSDWWIIGSSILGVVIFTLLTAFDVQKLKRIFSGELSAEQKNTITIYGALQLYLDFVNLFLYILKLINRSK